MLCNKHIFTLKSRDINPTGAEIMGVLSPVRWINNNAFLKLFVWSSPPAGPTASSFSYTYFFFNLGNWKTFDYGGTAWLPPGVLAARIPNVRCSFSACVIFKGTPVRGSNSPIQWRKTRQAEVDSIYIKMARLTESQCRLCSLETVGFPQWQGLNRAEGKLRIGWGGTSESRRNS